MTNMPLTTLFIQGIPECICICALCFVLLQIRLEWLKIIPLGAAMALMAFLVRLLPLVPGEPTIILIVLTSIIIKLLFKEQSYPKVLFTVITVVAAIVLLEALFLPLGLRLLRLTFDEARQQPVLFSLLGLPHVAAGYIIVAAVYFGRRFYEKQKERRASKRQAMPDL